MIKRDEALINLHRAKRYREDNKRLKYMLSYYISQREWSTVIAILNDLNGYTKDPNFIRQYSNLFITNPLSKEFFGIGEDIVGSMSRMVFGGNVNIKVDQRNVQKQIDILYNDGYFVDNIINTYKAAISTSGRSYLFFDTVSHYEAKTQVKIKDEFIEFKIVPEHELEIRKDHIIRRFFKEVVVDKKEVMFEFRYNYYISKENATLVIEGFDDNNTKISEERTMDILGIETIYEKFDFIPFHILNVGEGMLPNIVHIENSLAENLYFQDEDLPNSQTEVLIPEQQLYVIGDLADDKKGSMYNKYQKRKIIKGSIDKGGDAAQIIEGKSAIATIEKNLALNVIQACLDAKISPVSLGYNLVDRLGNNTDVGTDKERVSIRLRDSHIDRLKVFISKVVKQYLLLHDFNVPIEKISVLFAQYITPSTETLTNVLAKQVQFGIKSIPQAVTELNRDELSQEEVDKEVDFILSQSQAQIDLNMAQRNEKNIKGVDNRLKSDGIEE